MKAKPVPARTTVLMSFLPDSWARLPRIPKIVHPAIRLVPKSMIVTTVQSLKKYFLFKSLERKSLSLIFLNRFHHQLEKIPRNFWTLVFRDRTNLRNSWRSLYFCKFWNFPISKVLSSWILEFSSFLHIWQIFALPSLLIFKLSNFL